MPQVLTCSAQQHAQVYGERGVAARPRCPPLQSRNCTFFQAPASLCLSQHALFRWLPRVHRPHLPRPSHHTPRSTQRRGMYAT